MGGCNSTSNASSSSAVAVHTSSSLSRLDALLDASISKNGGVDYVCKLLMLGDSGVGKSSIMIRFADDTFSESYTSTIGIDFKIRTLEVRGKRVKVQIWDTAGQERFRTITRSYYKGIHGYLLVFDITSKKSFEHVAHWLKEIEENGVEGVPKVIVGNKSDLTHLREVESADGAAFGTAWGMDYLETSAKANANVKEAVRKMVTSFVDQVLEYEARRKA